MKSEFIQKPVIFERNEAVCVFNPITLNWEFKREKCDSQIIERKISVSLPKAALDTLQVIVTTRCNLNCSYCSVRHLMDSQEKCDLSDTDFNLIEKIINGMDNKKLLVLTGGEPLLCVPNLIRISKHFIGKKVIFTNGILLDAEIAIELARNDIEIIVSLDGTSRESMRYRIGENEKLLEKIMSNLDRIAEIGMQFGLSMVVSDANISTLISDIKALHRRYPGATFGVNLPHHSITGVNPDITDGEFITLFLGLCDLSFNENIYIDQIARKMRSLIKREFRFRDCSAQGQKVVYLPGGKITNCINELNNCMDIWSSTTPINSETCQRCYAVGVCGGGCIFDSTYYMNESGFERRHCKIIRELLPSILWHLYDLEGLRANDREYLSMKYTHLMDSTFNKNTRFSIGH